MSNRTRNTAPTSIAALQKSLRTSRRVNVVLAAVVFFLAIVVVAQTSSDAPTPGASAPGPTAPGSDAAPTTSPTSGPAQRTDGDPQALGPVDAPVVISEWADFRCPFCAVFTNETLPTLIQEYVDKGLVRYEFNDAILFGEQSLNAAVAARAAGEQGRFHEYMAAVYAAAPERSHPDLPREKLITFAESAGVPDINKFTADLDRKDLRVAVEISNSRAKRLGATSVPYFVIGDEVVAGAQPIDTFRRILDEQLALAGR
ncbi:disulfide bond formation protein [Nakamurella silvestris]|nr:disulfide bond formation protein [Nakamurella silvestris]